MSKSHNLCHTIFCMLLAVAGLVLASGSVRAQVKTERPWSKGVSQEQQNKAEALYQEGNRDFTNGFLTAAVAKYQAALQHWNHPGIHYNLALALISLDRPIEAYESIVAALSHGMDALAPEEHQRAIDYERMLRRKIATVEVVCDEPGAVVTLDGKSLFTGPGRVTTKVLSGKHQLVASKAGYLTTSKAFTLAGAARTRVELRLVAAYQLSTRVQQRRIWPRWAMIGLGLGAGVVGGMMHWQFSVDSGRLDDALRQRCPVNCTPYPTDLSLLRERVKWQRTVAYTGYSMAAGFLAAGAALAYFNRAQPMISEARRETVQISLSVGGLAGSSGISVHIPF